MLTVFLICCILVPYSVYTVLATFLLWKDRRRKTTVQHCNELTSALLLGTSLYYLGGYSESFHPAIPIVTTSITILYGFLTELAVFQTSFPDWRSWRWQMYAVAGTLTLFGLGLLVLHVLYAIGRWGLKVALGGYLGTFILVPVCAFLLVYSIAMRERQMGELKDARDDEGNEGFEFELGTDDEDDDDDEQPILRPRASGDGRQSDAAQPSEREAAGEEGDAEEIVRTLPPRPLRRPASTRLLVIKKSLRLHLHHYQLFAFLALYTRFPVLFSQLSAGIVLGGMMHGIAAYGVDGIFEFYEDV